MEPLNRSEEVVVVKGMEWRPEGASSTAGRWEALRRDTTRVGDVVRRGEYLSADHHKRVPSRWFKEEKPTELLQKANAEIARLKSDMYKIKRELDETKLSNDVLRDKVETLTAELARASLSDRS